MGLYEPHVCHSAHAALTWDQANDQLIQGKAAMTIMGDWTNGDYTQKKFTDYGWTLAPGAKGVFDALSDTFALPKNAKNRDNAINSFVTKLDVPSYPEGARVRLHRSRRLQVAPDPGDLTLTPV